VRLFLDVNVPFDVLVKRKPWYKDSAAVLSLLESNEFEGFVAAQSITTLFYLSAKKLGKPNATAALVDLLNLVAVVPLDQPMILKAIALEWADFEDALQAVSSVHSRADYLVTRNPADFRAASIPVVTPSEFLGIVRADAGSHRSASR
jgi:predicted nucleic acid-binding protein